MRLDPVMRHALLLRAALHVANRHGLENLTHPAVAVRARVSLSTVYRWAATRKQLRDRVIEGGSAKILAEAGRLGLH